MSGESQRTPRTALRALPNMRVETREPGNIRERRPETSHGERRPGSSHGRKGPKGPLQKGNHSPEKRKPLFESKQELNFQFFCEGETRVAWRRDLGGVGFREIAVV